MTSPTPDRVPATYPRRPDGGRVEVRVTLAVLPNGTRLLRIRRGIRLDSGKWRPTEKGFALQANEMRALARLPDGTPLLPVRRVFRLDSGEWRPTKEGVAFKAGELRDLEAAVRRARDVLNGEDPGVATPR